MATFQQLLSNIDKLENSTYSGFLDISKFFLPVEEAGKNLLKSIHPELTEENLNDVMDAKEKGEQKIEEEEKKKAEKEEQEEKEKEAQEDAQDEEDPDAEREKRKQERQESRAKRKEERKKRQEERKKLRKEQNEERKKIFKDKKEQIIKEVKEIMQRIKESVHKLWVEYLNLIQKLATGLVKNVNALVAAIITAVAPPWNIANAVVILLQVIEFYLDLLKQLNLVAPILAPLKFLQIVIKPEQLGVVSNILNPLIVGILALYAPFAKFNALVSKLMNKLIEFINNPTKLRNVFRKTTRKLKKAGYCQSGDMSQVSDDDKEEVEDILKTYKIGACTQEIHGGLSGVCTKCVIGYKSDESGTEGGSGEGGPSTSTGDNGTAPGRDGGISGKNLSALMAYTNKNFVKKSVEQSIASSEGDYVYDVELPDGTVLVNQTESSLQNLKKQYTVLLRNL